MHPHEVVENEVERQRVDVTVNLFGEAFVRQVKRRMCISIERFWRSHATGKLSSGLPEIVIFLEPASSRIFT